MNGRMILLTLSICLVISACVNARQGEPVALEQAKTLGQQVKIYQAAELGAAKYTSLGPVEASGCRWMLWDETPTEEGVTNQLLLKAAELNANGITNVSCESGTAAALMRDCWSRVACTAEAIRVE